MERTHARAYTPAHLGLANKLHGLCLGVQHIARAHVVKAIGFADYKLQRKMERVFVTDAPLHAHGVRGFLDGTKDRGRHYFLQFNI